MAGTDRSSSASATTIRADETPGGSPAAPSRHRSAARSRAAAASSSPPPSRAKAWYALSTGLVRTGSSRSARGRAKWARDGGRGREARAALGGALRALCGRGAAGGGAAPGKAGEKPAGVVPPPHREGRQLESGDPSLGAPLQRRHVRRGQ